MGNRSALERHYGVHGDVGLRARLNALTDRRGPDECWPWLGYRVTDGYGSLAINGRREIASRVILAHALGRPIGDGLQALHSCDNPPCVNPAHLREGTPKDNVDDRMARGRWRGFPARSVLRGSAHPSARLDEAAVTEIRRRLALGESQRMVARAFGVCRSSIYNIAAGETWRHVA